MTKTDEPVGEAADWDRLKDIYFAMGDYDKAAEAAQKAVDLEPNNCGNWQKLGTARHRLGEHGKANTAFARASEIYHAWYDLSLADRKIAQGIIDKLDDDAKDAYPHQVAASACHTADASLAAASFIAGDVLKIEALYRQHFDLDPRLGLIAGNALIVKGDLAHAMEPIRQALKAGGTMTLTRLSLAVIYAEQGDWDTASKLFDRVLSQSFDVQTLRVWMNALGEAHGHEAVIAGAVALVKRYPASIAARTGLAYALVGSDNGPMKAKARRAAELVFERRLAQFPQSALVAGVYARWLNQWESGSEMAMNQAHRALDIDSNAADALMALAELYGGEGVHGAATTDWAQRAGQTNVFHIGYAGLLGEPGVPAAQ